MRYRLALQGRDQEGRWGTMELCPTWAQRGPVRLAARRSAASELLSVSQGDLKQFLRISKSKDESLKPQPLTTKHKVIAQLWKRCGAWGPPRKAAGG